MKLYLKILPFCLILFHAFYITPKGRIDYHWYIYILLFIYFLLVGEVQKIIREIRQEICKLSFLIKVLLILAGDLVCVLLILRQQTSFFYETWLVYPLVLWLTLYIVVQPLVNAVIFESMLLADGSFKALAIGSIMLWTYIETGAFVTKNATAGLLPLAYFVSAAIPVCFYLYTKKISVSYMGDMLFRLSTAIMVSYALSAIP